MSNKTLTAIHKDGLLNTEKIYLGVNRVVEIQHYGKATPFKGYPYRVQFQTRGTVTRHIWLRGNTHLQIKEQS